MKKTNFQLVSAMNSAFGNPKGNSADINFNRVRSQTINVFDEFIETMGALGLEPSAIDELKLVRQRITLERFGDDSTVNLNQARDGLCDINVFSYGAHHMMGIDADRDMSSVVGGVMTRFIKDEADKVATQALHAAKGVTNVYFEGDYPVMVMKSGADQPDAPKGKFLKSVSYREPEFYRVDTQELEEEDRKSVV